MPQKSKIKLFRDGRYLGVRHQSTIEALVARGLVELEFNCKGYVVAAHERPATVPIVVPVPKPPALAKIPTATPYSFEDQAIDGRPWELRRLDGRRFGVDYAPLDVLPLFTRVVRSCLR